LLFSVSDIGAQSRYKDDILKDFDPHMQLEASPELPIPDADSAAHSVQCAEFIRARVEDSGGSISFAEFMQHALYAPGLGYYAAGASKFGAAGDFVTAPEVSSLFASVIARQCAEVLEQVGDDGSILEFGAGSGRLAVDVLTKLDELNALPARYQILEVSADLRERQEQLLRVEGRAFLERIEWLDRIPESISGVLIANEVLDAMPVERFVRRETVRQQRVIAKGKDFALVEADASPQVVAAVEAIEANLGERLPTGFGSEVSLGAPGWVTDIVTAMREGVAFLFDYGVSQREYFARDRSDGWLRCHFRHRAHNDPLCLPGIQDITAWVDFSAIAEAAANAGADIAGYVSQAQFLLNGGLEAELRNMSGLSPERQIELSAEVKLLTLPAEMGESFKCLGISRGAISQPSAFQHADRTHTL
jgi:SAM-dependent MidA family methyltransferase